MNINSANYTANRGGGGGMSALSADDFTRIILTELSNQDPLQPNDTNQLLEQMSTLRSIQSNIDLSDQLTQITNQNSFSAAASMIGKSVTGYNTDLERVTDEVLSVSLSSDGIMLNLKSQGRMPMSLLETVAAPTGSKA